MFHRICSHPDAYGRARGFTLTVIGLLITAWAGRDLLPEWITTDVYHSTMLGWSVFAITGWIIMGQTMPVEHVGRAVTEALHTPPPRQAPKTCHLVLVAVLGPLLTLVAAAFVLLCTLLLLELTVICGLRLLKGGP